MTTVYRKVSFGFSFCSQIWDMSDDESIWRLNLLKERTLRPPFWNLGPTATHTHRHSPDEAHQWNGPRRRALHSHNRLLSLPCEAYSRHLIRCEDHFITPGLTINTSVGLSQGSGGKMWDELWQHLNVSLTGGCSQRSSWCSFHPLTVQPATAAAGSDASLAFRIPSFFNCHLCIML